MMQNRSFLNKKTSKSLNKMESGLGEKLGNRESKKRKIMDYTKKCRQFKWYTDQKTNLNRLLLPCKFCQDVYFRSVTCDECLCPQSICDNDGNKGLIGYFKNKYGNIYLCDFDRKDYTFMIKILTQLSNNGFLNEDYKRKISELMT